MFGFGYTGIIASMKKLPSGGGNGVLTTAWITATSETDTTIISALNTLETDLTTYGLTAKIKALYPMVGGTAAKHKFNFMDARDLDAAYRLTFNGGWTHASTGALPNGTNAYANTFGTQASFMAVGSGHMSYYSRTTGSSGQNQYEMGNYAGAGYTTLAVRNNDRLQGHINAASLPFTTANTDGKGFYVASRISATNLIQQKNSTQYTTTAVEAYSAGNIVIGAVGTMGTPQAWSTKECAFASIGLALSSTELTNFNSAMATFQTTLARQV